MNDVFSVSTNFDSMDFDSMNYFDDEVFDEEAVYYATDSTEFTLPIELNSEIDYTGITNVYFWCDRQLQYKTTGSIYTTLGANARASIPLSLFSNYLYNLKLIEK